MVGSADHVAKAEDATRQGFVLLKNGVPNPKNPSPVLPFTLGIHAKAPKVAVVGPHVNSRSAILGNYLGQMCPDRYDST